MLHKAFLVVRPTVLVTLLLCALWPARGPALLCSWYWDSYKYLLEFTTQLVYYLHLKNHGFIKKYITKALILTTHAISWYALYTKYINWIYIYITWFISYLNEYIPCRNPYPVKATHTCQSPKDDGRYGWREQDMDFKGRYMGRYEII